MPYIRILAKCHKKKLVSFAVFLCLYFVFIQALVLKHYIEHPFHQKTAACSVFESADAKKLKPSDDLVLTTCIFSPVYFAGIKPSFIIKNNYCLSFPRAPPFSIIV